MEKKYIAFETGAGCGVGCLGYVLMVVLCVAVYWPGVPTWLGFGGAAVIGVAMFVAAFAVDRRAVAKKR